MQEADASYERVLLATYQPAPPLFVRGRGSELFDDQDRRYIDLSGGIAVNLLGHAGLAATLTDAAGRLVHLSNLFRCDLVGRTASRLLELSGLQRVFFANSGSEANEGALKCARKRGQRIDREKYRVISFEGSFHGRLGFALAASGQENIRSGFGPLAGGFVHLPADDRDRLRRECDERLCAVIVEPIMGEGGIRPVDPQTIELAGQLCQQHDALLILDEIQSGCGRTGSFFCYQQLGLHPDVVTAAKGLGAGLPVAAVLAGPRAGDVFAPGDHGSTFGGNLLAMAAVNAVLDELERKEFLEQVLRKGALASEMLAKQAADAASPIVEVRGRGLMLGVRLDPQALSARDAFLQAVAAGVLVAPAGDNVIRILPALNIEDRILQEGLDLLAGALRARQG